MFQGWKKFSRVRTINVSLLNSRCKESVTGSMPAWEVFETDCNFFQEVITTENCRRMVDATTVVARSMSCRVVIDVSAIIQDNG